MPSHCYASARRCRDERQGRSMVVMPEEELVGCCLGGLFLPCSKIWHVQPAAASGNVANHEALWCQRGVKAHQPRRQRNTPACSAIHVVPLESWNG